MTMQLAEREKLIGFIAEIEASRDRAKSETRHQSDVFKKAKESGFDNKAMRKVLQRRAMSRVDREKMDELVDAYEHALGALAQAREAVSAGMSAREAAERYHVPRGALGVLAGARNVISEPLAKPDIISPPEVATLPAATPAHDLETGEIDPPAAPLDDPLALPPHLDRRQRASA